MLLYCTGRNFGITYSIYAISGMIIPDSAANVIWLLFTVF